MLHFCPTSLYNYHASTINEVIYMGYLSAEFYYVMLNDGVHNYRIEMDIVLQLPPRILEVREQLHVQGFL